MAFTLFSLPEALIEIDWIILLACFVFAIGAGDDVGGLLTVVGF